MSSQNNDATRARSLTCPRCKKVSVIQLKYKYKFGWIGKCPQCGQRIRLAGKASGLVRDPKTGSYVRGEESG